MMWCAICGSRVFRSARSGGWFHDVHPREVATVAREVTDQRQAWRSGKPAVTEIARLP